MGRGVPWTASPVHDACGAGIYGELATTRQILRLPWGQFAATARRQYVSEAQDRLPIASGSRIFVATRFPLWPGISRVPLHTIHSPFVGSILYARTGLLPRAAGAHAAAGQRQFCAVLTGNRAGIVGRIWRRYWQIGYGNICPLRVDRASPNMN